MKVAVWYSNRDIRIEEVEKPVPGKDEMLVKIIACGLCGSDIVDWYRLPRAPLIPGHEIGGEVVEVGENVKKFKLGDRVFIAPKVPCLSCRYCESGHYPIRKKAYRRTSVQRNNFHRSGSNVWELKLDIKINLEQ